MKVISTAHETQVRRLIVASKILGETTFIKIRNERIISNGEIMLRNADSLSLGARECIRRIDYQDYLKWAAVIGGNFFSARQASEAAEFFETAPGARIADELADGKAFSISIEDRDAAEPYRDALQHFQSASPRFLNQVNRDQGVMVSLMVSDCMTFR